MATFSMRSIVRHSARKVNISVIRKAVCHQTSFVTESLIAIMHSTKRAVRIARAHRNRTIKSRHIQRREISQEFHFAVRMSFNAAIYWNVFRLLCDAIPSKTALTGE